MTKLPLLVEASDLAEHINNPEFLFVQVTSPDVFAKIHIPNAAHIAPHQLMSGEDPARGKLPSKEKLSQVLSSIGFTGKQHVIAYDDEGGGWAGRLIWTLDMIGHKNSSYLNGGLHAWHAEKLPLSAQPADVTKSNYTVEQFHSEHRITSDEIVNLLDQESFAVWDARSPAEHAGMQVFAQRGGHIPGAKNLEWTELMDRQNNLRLLPLENIQETLNELGLSKDKTIATHCQSHHRSGLTYLVAKILNYPNIKAYDGSWSEWGNTTNLPVEV